ncbi:MAG: hypothetical protein L0Y72_08950 [Gemmataceae bacterium]|nr:hypothetical protein [Gemmataceae bacterium]MCI0739158.1 hypothetical protein [Gemmataceae bacterium]
MARRIARSVMPRDVGKTRLHVRSWRRRLGCPTPVGYSERGILDSTFDVANTFLDAKKRHGNFTNENAGFSREKTLGKICGAVFSRAVRGKRVDVVCA